MGDEMKRAGWYPDPDGAAGERWWNGAGWSETRRDTVAQPVVPPIPASPSPIPQRPDPYAAPGTQPTPGAVVTPGSYASSSPRAGSVGGIDARANRNALVGFITGIISVFFNLFFLLAPVAIVFSALGLRKARELRAQGAPKTMMVFAVIGLCAGIFATVVGLFQFIGAIAAFSD